MRCRLFVCLARLAHIGRAPACAPFGSPSARSPPKGVRLSPVHPLTACSALRAIPSLRSALTAFGGYVLITSRFVCDPCSFHHDSSAKLILAYQTLSDANQRPPSPHPTASTTLVDAKILRRAISHKNPTPSSRLPS